MEDSLRAKHGLSIELPSGVEIDFIPTDGPPGLSPDTIAADVGSYASEISKARIWVKGAPGAGVDKWSLVGLTRVFEGAIGTAFTTLDTISSAGVLAVEWLIYGQAANKTLAERLVAISDADPPTAATSVDYNEYGEVKIGNIPGLQIRAVLVGGDIELQAKDNGSATVMTVTRNVIPRP